ncbi:MAG: ABC transporter substrate-binding protein [Acidimicrobiales bacterium]
MTRRIRTRSIVGGGLVVVAVAAFVLARAGETTTARAAGNADWATIAATARGQTVKLWMWGGEDALNRYVDDDVVPRAAAAGVHLERVPIDDTATALARIAAERDAGRTTRGAVDLLWVNGKNFAQGKAAGLWLTGWADRVPNTKYLDPSDPTTRYDFGVATDSQELAWSRAAFVFASDSAKVSEPPKDFDALAAYVRAHPGRFTYPAPPDFTGSAFVRQAVQALGEDKAFTYLQQLQPYLWQQGKQYPKDEPELERLFADGQVDLAMSYNPNFVDTGVARGAFAGTVRPYVFTTGTLQNVSFLAIPSNASSPEGAQVVADLFLSPALQAAKLAKVGIPTVLDLDLLGVDAALFATSGSPHRLDRFGTPLEELPADRVPILDRRWRNEVLR